MQGPVGRGEGEVGEEGLGFLVGGALLGEVRDQLGGVVVGGVKVVGELLDVFRVFDVQRACDGVEEGARLVDGVFVLGFVACIVASALVSLQDGKMESLWNRGL